MHAKQVGRDAAHIARSAHVAHVRRLVQPLVDEGHGLDPVAAVLQRLDDDGILDAGSLHIQEAGNDLQVVLHPVMDLLQHKLLLSQRGSQSLAVAHELGAQEVVVDGQGQGASDLTHDLHRLGMQAIRFVGADKQEAQQLGPGHEGSAGIGSQAPIPQQPFHGRQKLHRLQVTDQPCPVVVEIGHGQPHTVLYLITAAFVAQVQLQPVGPWHVEQDAGMATGDEARQALEHGRKDRFRRLHGQDRLVDVVQDLQTLREAPQVLLGANLLCDVAENGDRAADLPINIVDGRAVGHQVSLLAVGPGDAQGDVGERLAPEHRAGHGQIRRFKERAIGPAQPQLGQPLKVLGKAQGPGKDPLGSRVGQKHPALRVGHDDPLRGVVDDCPEPRPFSGKLGQDSLPLGDIAGDGRQVLYLAVRPAMGHEHLGDRDLAAFGVDDGCLPAPDSVTDRSRDGLLLHEGAGRGRKDLVKGQPIQGRVVLQPTNAASRPVHVEQIADGACNEHHVGCGFQDGDEAVAGLLEPNLLRDVVPRSHGPRGLSGHPDRTGRGPDDVLPACRVSKEQSPTVHCFAAQGAGHR